MPGKSKYTKPAAQAPPQPGDVLWCPLPGCSWHLEDSWSARRRMGEHVANKHTEDVVYPKGQQPEDLNERV